MGMMALCLIHNDLNLASDFDEYEIQPDISVSLDPSTSSTSSTCSSSRLADLAMPSDDFEEELHGYYPSSSSCLVSTQCLCRATLLSTAFPFFGVIFLLNGQALLSQKPDFLAVIYFSIRLSGRGPTMFIAFPLLSPLRIYIPFHF